jgi:hypothetical protein
MNTSFGNAVANMLAKGGPPTNPTHVNINPPTRLFSESFLSLVINANPQVNKSEDPIPRFGRKLIS